MSIWESKQLSLKARIKHNILHEGLHDFLRSEYRIIYCNHPTANNPSHFQGNAISTTKYNVFTFLPKCLFEQFRRVANIYFLFIAILSASPISPLRPETTISPLVVILSVSLVKEAFEDWKRFKHDQSINSNLIEVSQGGEWNEITWSKLSVGDIVRVQSNQHFPADLLLLASSNIDNNCYVETSNLDGEASLKVKKALEETRDCIDPKAAKLFKGIVKCEQPNESLHTFTGSLTIGADVLQLSSDQLLLRGCSLRNTEWIVGAVIYAGSETKIMMNSLDIPSKRSTLEQKLDKLIYAAFLLLFVICFIQAVSCGFFLRQSRWYLGALSSVDDQFGTDGELEADTLIFLTFITLYNTLIPLSLYVSLEIIKFIQCTQFINKDINMYHLGTGMGALARTSNLNEELGQIEYIISDKTGTLTRNVMEFFKCSIGGEIYGTGMSDVEKARTNQSDAEEKPESEEENSRREFNFNDSRLLGGSWRNESTSEICKEFFRCLALCHSVLPVIDKENGTVRYEAPSPDEAALVAAAKNFGFILLRRNDKTIIVHEFHVESLDCSKDVEYEILDVLEFNSTRKRQSIICHHPDGKLALYCKGADEIIFERLAEKDNAIARVTKEHIDTFASNGLRTLCLAHRELSLSIYRSWKEKLTKATSSSNSEEEVCKAQDAIEQELLLLGCVAIEDKLQDGVAKCMEMLGNAGIKIWVLTGDKLKTAINIAYACKILCEDMENLIVSSDANLSSMKEGQFEGTTELTADMVRRQLLACLTKTEDCQRSHGDLCTNLIIEGNCLHHALEPDLRGYFLRLCLLCKAVVCCRTTPLQKAQVASLLKYDAKKITLSVGDGANDVSMIQAAHVGVAIRGQEGMQAVMASDFAIPQFKFLCDLLLVHGRWSYIRISKVVAYFLYKNIAFTLVQFWFNFYTGFSGQRFYDDWSQTLYNVLFTALPVLMMGLFEKDVSATVSKQVPQLYRSGIDNLYFRWIVLLTWFFFSILHSVIVFYFSVLAGQNGQNGYGKTLGLWDMGTTAFTSVVIIVNVRLLMECNILTIWHHVSVWGSIVGWFIFIVVYSVPAIAVKGEGSMMGEMLVLLGTWYFWALLLLLPIATLLCDFLYSGIQRWFAPYDYQILQERCASMQNISQKRASSRHSTGLNSRLLGMEWEQETGI